MRFWRCSVIVAALGGTCTLAACNDFAIAGASADSNSQPSDDAGLDAGMVGADSGTFCSTRNAYDRFCADFDDVTAVGDGWSLTHIETGGSLALDDTLFQSPSRSARFAAPVPLDGGVASTWLRREIADIKNLIFHVYFEYSVRIEDLGGSEVLISSFTLGPDVARTVFDFRVTEQGASLFTQRQGHGDVGVSVSEARLAKRSPHKGAWARIAFDFDVTTSPPTLAVTVDGQEAIAQYPLGGFPDAMESRDPRHLVVEVGAMKVRGGQAPVSVSFDDVEVRDTHFEETR